MNVLIIKSSSLGDIVHSLPAATAFAAARPEARIDWLIEARWAGLLEGHPLIRRLIVFDSHAPRQNPFSPQVYAGFIDLVSRLRRVRYEAAVDLQRLTKSAAMMLLVRARRRYGFAWNSCREPASALVTSRRAKIDYQHDQIREQYLAPLSLAAGTELELPQPPYLWPQDEAVESLAGKFPAWPRGRPYGVALLGGAFGTKLWPIESWREVLARLAESLPVILPWAGEAERRAAAEAADGVSGVVIPPPMDLKELAALLAGAKLVIGGDTGPLHLAAALGRPTVSFYGPTLAERNAPPGHAAVQSPVECTGCVKRVCPKGRPDCLTAIGPEVIWREVETLL